MHWITKILIKMVIHLTTLILPKRVTIVILILKVNKVIHQMMRKLRTEDIVKKITKMLIYGI